MKKKILIEYDDCEFSDGEIASILHDLYLRSITATESRPLATSGAFWGKRFLINGSKTKSKNKITIRGKGVDFTPDPF